MMHPVLFINNSIIPGSVVVKFFSKMVAITGPGTALQELLSGIIMALILVYAALFEITHYSDKESFAFAVIGMCVTWGVIDGVLAYYSWMVNARHQHRVLTNVDNIDRETRLNEIKDSFSGTTLDLLTEKSEMEICNTILDSEIESDEELKADDNAVLKSTIGFMFFGSIGIIPVLLPLLFYDDLLEALDTSCTLAAITLFAVGYIMGPYLGLNRFLLGIVFAGISAIISVIAVFTGG